MGEPIRTLATGQATGARRSGDRPAPHSGASTETPGREELESPPARPQVGVDRRTEFEGANLRGETAGTVFLDSGGADVASMPALGGYGTLGSDVYPDLDPMMRAKFSKVILRKEVIQPQVPLRLPCYDLVPITGFTFGACLAAPATSDAPRFGGLTGGVYKAQEHIHRGMLIRDY